jgi:hypothetical protein
MSSFPRSERRFRRWRQPWPHAAFSQRAMWPPSAAVRQRSIALITFNLVEARMAAVGLAPRGTVLAEDVRDLQNGRTMTDGGRGSPSCQSLSYRLATRLSAHAPREAGRSAATSCHGATGAFRHWQLPHGLLAFSKREEAWVPAHLGRCEGPFRSLSYWPERTRWFQAAPRCPAVAKVDKSDNRGRWSPPHRVADRRRQESL